MLQSRTVRSLLVLAGTTAISLGGASASADVMKIRGTGPVVVADDAHCLESTAELPFGGVAIELTFDKNRLPKGEFYVAVPRNVETGLDAGERFTVEGSQRTATAVIPADGHGPTPVSAVDVVFGGQVVQSVPVTLQCGELDPTPDLAPEIVGYVVEGRSITVTVTNPNGTEDTVLVSLWASGSNSAPTTFVTLAAGGTGSVQFDDVDAGGYRIEAESVTTYRRSAQDIVIA